MDMSPNPLIWRYDIAERSIFADAAGHRYMMYATVLRQMIVSGGLPITASTHTVVALDTNPDKQPYILGWIAFLDNHTPDTTPAPTDITKARRGRKPTGVKTKAG